MRTIDPELDVSGAELTDDGGPPIGFAWTLCVEGEDGWEADLQHAAPMPRVGELVEFIGEDGRRAKYQVTRVLHTVQTAASLRPTVAEEHSLPNSLVTDGAHDFPPRELRAGLPRVFVTTAEDDGP